jgi:uncharacterized protein (DUF58 family)
MAQQPLIDRTFLEKLERLALHWQKSFPGLVGGHNVSRFSGPGLEFLDHRRFHAGDDLRAVNWQAYLRFEKLFLKMFRVEPHTPIRLLIDTSESMSTGAIPKFDYARRIAAALAYVGLVRLDTIVMHGFSGVLAEQFRCGGGRHHFSPAVSYLERLSRGGRTDFLRVVRQFISSYSQRGLLVVVSDFLDDQNCEKALELLADYGHELMLVHVWAEEDRVPPWEGELELSDAETGAHLKLEFDTDARGKYTAAFDAYARALRRIALRNDGRYTGLSTSMPVEDAVFGPLAGMGAVA